MIPRLDDDEAWADAPPSHVGCAYPLSDKPRRKIKAPEFPIGFEIPNATPPAPPKKARRRKRKGR